MGERDEEWKFAGRKGVENRADNRQRQYNGSRNQVSAGDKVFLAQRAVLRIVARRRLAMLCFCGRTARERLWVNVSLGDVAGLRNATSVSASTRRRQNGPPSRVTRKPLVTLGAALAFP